MAPDPQDWQSVRAWMAAWGNEVAAVELARARARFDPDVVSFGTVAEMARGLDQLYDEQWSRVWPAIREFQFELDELEVLVSPDRLLAVAAVPWSSAATASSVDASPRHGRATVVLRREDVDDPWRGVHTHFSLVPTGLPAG